MTLPLATGQPAEAPTTFAYAGAPVPEGDGSSGDDLCQTVFDDAATQSFASVPANRAPFTGSWRPALGRLDEFLLQPVDGDWTFKVVDRASRDTGSIRAVGLHITGFAE